MPPHNHVYKQPISNRVPPPPPVPPTQQQRSRGGSIGKTTPGYEPISTRTPPPPPASSSPSSKSPSPSSSSPQPLSSRTPPSPPTEMLRSVSTPNGIARGPAPHPPRAQPVLGSSSAPERSQRLQQDIQSLSSSSPAIRATPPAPSPRPIPVGGGNPYKAAAAPSPVITRRPSINDSSPSSPLIMTSSSVYSPNVSSAASTPNNVFSPPTHVIKRAPPPKPTLGATPSLDHVSPPTSRSVSPVRTSSVVPPPRPTRSGSGAPTPSSSTPGVSSPRVGPPTPLPRPAAAVIATSSPAANSSSPAIPTSSAKASAPPITVARALQQNNRPLASSAPMVSRSPMMMTASPMMSSSPAVVSSPMNASSPAVASPSGIMSPPVPLPRNKPPATAVVRGFNTPDAAAAAAHTNYDSGSEYAPIGSSSVVGGGKVWSPANTSSPLKPARPQGTNGLKASVGIMRNMDPNNANNGTPNGYASGNNSPALLSSSLGIPNNNSNNNGNNDSNNGNDSSDYYNTINNLKRQTHLLKSPMVKDYLMSQNTQSAHNSPVVPRRAAARRSVTPPASRPAASMDGSTTARPRKLSDPVPLQCNHLTRKAELLGTQDGISMPYNVTHTTHINLQNFDILAKDDNHLLLLQSNIPENEKYGHLYKLAGPTFKERWFVCKDSVLTYYLKRGDSKPRGQIYLVDCEFRRDKLAKRPHTLHLNLISTKKHYYLSALNNEVMEEWVRALHSGGAVDKDLVVFEKEVRVMEKKAEEAKQAREARKRENEYVKEKLKKRSTLKISNKNMPDAVIRDCVCVTQVEEVKVTDEARVEFKINVTFDDQKWTIFRKYDKVTALYNAVYKLKFTKDMCPPKKKRSSMSESDFAKLQVSKLQELLDALAQNRMLVLNSSSTKQGYLRFLAPVGWEDIKPDDFIMPYAFEL